MIANLGSATQEEENSTYTALAVFTGLENEEQAEQVSIIMMRAISDYLESNGVKGIKSMLQ